MSPRTLYIIYNADGTVLGKLKYGYRKLSSSTPEQPACAACDLTHGGLSLTESAAWSAARAEIESAAGLKVAQLHRDEIGPALKLFVQQGGLRYPLVVLEEGNDAFRQVLSREDLAQCKGSPEAFVEKLKEAGIIRKQASL